MLIRLERVASPAITSGLDGPQAESARADRSRPTARRRRVAVVCALVAALLGSGATIAAWALVGPPGAVGHDVSYPQCGTALPTTGTFGIVGVNGGKVSVANPCLSSQYAWAARTANGAALYANTGNPGSISTFYWPASGSRDPALCANRTSAADSGCAYDYGWHGGQDSLKIAKNTVGSAATSRTWWLDVELANSWNGSTTANAAALQGALDAIREGGVATVGIYSTAYQWGQITGGYSTRNAATYRSAWAASFTPKHPMEQAPVWIAGLGTLDAASTNCSASFTGGSTAIAQYTDGNTDGDLICGAPPTTTPTPTSSPTPTTTTTPSTTSALPTTTTAPSTTPSTGATTTTTAPTSSSPTTTTTTSAPTSTTTTSAPGAAIPTVAPGTPVAVAGNASVALSWAAPAGAQPGWTYSVLRTDPGATTPTVVAHALTTTSWTDRGVTNGRTYTYRVAAATTAGTGPASAPVTATPAAAPGPPTAVTAQTDSAAGVDLRWTAPQATGGSAVNRYVIMRATSAGREAALGVLTCRTPTCAWRDASTVRGTTYYYQVVALDDANAMSPRSPEVSARAR
jgi:fibronectin type 3 domain-containing protein